MKAHAAVPGPLAAGSAASTGHAIFDSMAIDPLVERIAARQQRARARADRLRALVPRMGALLASRGARRVRLFGSLATGAEPHEATDVDLCVEGLDDASVVDATFALEAMAGVRVDLLRWEGASDRLRERIDRDGVEVSLDAP